jgi:hypothetical protein
VAEYAFELALCAHLERQRAGVLARQLGVGVRAPGRRVVDVVHVSPGPAFDERAALTGATIPPAAVESDVGTGRARHWKTAFDCHPEKARRAVDRAVEVGFFEREHRGCREYVRQVARYPDDWAGRVLGVENKPDLGSPGDLATQLRKDVALGLLDEVVLATESHVTGAHLNRIPDAVGVWRVHREDGGARDRAGNGAADSSHPALRVEVVREPTPLDDDGGVELLAEHPGRTDVAVADADDLAGARRRLLERAYGKGWRTYDLPGCVEVAPGDAGLPYCAWKGRVVDPGDCGPACPGFDPADPPAVDLDAVRDDRTDWVADPEGAASRQAGLDRFG